MTPQTPLKANEAWLESIANVYTYGEEISPRGQDTFEILNDHMVIDMNYPICYHQVRKLSYKFMAAEAYWIVSGSMFVEEIAPYNSHIANFSDDGYIFNGAYGPKFVNQFSHVVNCLKNDMYSRQAIISIWVPNPIDSKDIPCTISLQFLIRKNKLNTIVNMRSNDLWLGRPYDIFNFTIMTLRVLCELNRYYVGYLKLGTMYFSAGSSHIYKSNEKEVYNMLREKPNGDTSRVPENATENWSFIAASLLACRNDTDTTGLWKIRP